MDGSRTLQIHGDEHRIFRYSVLRFDWNRCSYNTHQFTRLLLYGKRPTGASLCSKYLSIKHQVANRINVQFHSHYFQYGGFLAVVFVLELGAGVSIYAYRNKLTTGFDNGLTQAMVNYRNDTTRIAADFDLMQETVRTSY